MITQKKELTIANVGDTRAVLVRNGVAERLSFDHKPNEPEER
jgi:protein phosphatase